MIVPSDSLFYLIKCTRGNNFHLQKLSTSVSWMLKNLLNLSQYKVEKDKLTSASCLVGKLYSTDMSMKNFTQILVTFNTSMENFTQPPVTFDTSMENFTQPFEAEEEKKVWKLFLDYSQLVITIIGVFANFGSFGVLHKHKIMT